MVKAAYMSHPPTCAEHYKLIAPKNSAVGQQNSALGALMKLRLENRNKLRERVDQQASGSRLCEPCAESGERRLATHRMNDLDMCVEHANAARMDSGPPQALKPDDSEVQAETPKERGMKHTIDAETIEEIRKLARQGKKPQQIANELSVSWPSAKKYSEGHFVAQNGGGDKKPSPKPAKVKVDRGPVNIPLRALVSPAVNSLIEKWNREANEAFAALPLEKKAELLSSLEA